MQANIEHGFTLKCIRDMTRTNSLGPKVSNSLPYHEIFRKPDNFEDSNKNLEWTDLQMQYMRKVKLYTYVYTSSFLHYLCICRF